eukprot:m.118174 g.118174  ORF g.118174 m.118174 type:complete len:73 (-) comp10966_c0_seq1:1587-1805(-)
MYLIAMDTCKEGMVQARGDPQNKTHKVLHAQPIVLTYHHKLNQVNKKSENNTQRTFEMYAPHTGHSTELALR